jgi:hypothetical protein
MVSAAQHRGVVCVAASNGGVLILNTQCCGTCATVVVVCDAMRDKHLLCSTPCHLPTCLGAWSPGVLQSPLHCGYEGAVGWLRRLAAIFVNALANFREVFLGLG